MTEPPKARPEACYGMTCPHRGKCALYEALGLNDGWVILHCRNGDDWPLFQQKGKPMRPTDRDDAQPLGPPIRKEPEKPAEPQWRPVPGKPGLERDSDGRLRTNKPENEAASMPPLPPIWYAMRR